MATEPAFGTVTVPSTFLPMSGNSLDLDPGLFWPKLMMGTRDTNVFPLYGQYKNAGSISGPLFPSNATSLLSAAIGQDAAAGKGVTGSTPTNATTVTPVTAGTSVATVASPTGYIIGAIVQLDVNNTVGPTTAEVRKITGVAGSVITVDVAWTYNHLTAAPIKTVVAPFVHTISQANSLPSLTVEKNLGGYESLQFSGTRVKKLDISATSGNQEISLTADLQAKHSAVLSTPSLIAITDESPFVFAETTVNLSGQGVLQATTGNVTIENGLKDTYTFNGSHDLQFLTPLTRTVSFKTDVVFTSLDDATWGYWTQMISTPGTNFPVTLTFAHPSSGGTIAFTMPKGRIKSYTDGVKMDDIILSTLSLDMALDLSTLTTITCTVTNNVYLPY